MSTGTTVPRLRWITVAALVALVVAIGFSTEYRSTASVAARAQAQNFDPAAYGAQTYASKVVPAIQQAAVELPDLIEALEEDKEAAGEKYGHRQGTSPYSFAVKGTGTAGEVKGTLLTVDVPGLPADTKVHVQIGPAVNGTALRDAAGFITFNQFRNQVEYADAATALNDRMREQVLKNLDAAALEGKKISFTGAFTLLTTSTVTITPIAIEEAP